METREMPVAGGRLKMHCPRCGSTNLTVQSNNRIVSSATAAQGFGKRSAVGVTSYNSETESFWFCQDCGKKFRDLDELLGLVAKSNKMTKICRIFLVVLLVFAALMAWMGTAAGTLVSMAFLVVLFGAFAAIFFALGSYWTRKGKEYQAEYDALAPKVWQRPET